MTAEPTYTVTFTDWEHAAILTLLETDSASSESSGSHDAEMWPLLEKMRGAQPDVEGEPAGTGGGSRSSESPSATPAILGTEYVCAHTHRWRMTETPRRCPVCGTTTFVVGGGAS